MHLSSLMHWGALFHAKSVLLTDVQIARNVISGNRLEQFSGPCWHILRDLAASLFSERTRCFRLILCISYSKAGAFHFSKEPGGTLFLGWSFLGVFLPFFKKMRMCPSSYWYFQCSFTIIESFLNFRFYTCMSVSCQKSWLPVSAVCFTVWLARTCGTCGTPPVISGIRLPETL